MERDIWVDPVSEQKNNLPWTIAGGAPTTTAAVAKGVNPPTVPSKTFSLTSTTTLTQARWLLADISLGSREYIEYIQVHVYAKTLANQKINANATHLDGLSTRSLNGTQTDTDCIVLPSASAEGWYAGHRISPHLDPADTTLANAPLTEDLFNSLVDVDLQMVESSAQAGNTEVWAVRVQVHVSDMERLEQDGTKLVGAYTRKRFAPWGPQIGDLDATLTDGQWRTKFQALRGMGVSAVRLHAPFGFGWMTASNTPDLTKFDRAAEVLDVAKEENLRVVLTGLNLYQEDQRPGYLDALSSDDRWTNFATWWKTAVKKFGYHPAVISWDLINEPGVHNASTFYYLSFGGFDFGAYLCKDADLAGRTDAEVVEDFTTQMVAAIRAYDCAKPVGWGILPFESGVFAIQELTEALNPHRYTTRGQGAVYMQEARDFAALQGPDGPRVVFPNEGGVLGNALVFDEQTELYRRLVGDGRYIGWLGPGSITSKEAFRIVNPPGFAGNYTERADGFSVQIAQRSVDTRRQRVGIKSPHWISRVHGRHL